MPAFIPALAPILAKGAAGAGAAAKGGGFMAKLMPALGKMGGAFGTNAAGQLGSNIFSPGQDPQIAPMQGAPIQPMQVQNPFSSPMGMLGIPGGALGGYALGRALGGKNGGIAGAILGGASVAVPMISNMLNSRKQMEMQMMQQLMKQSGKAVPLGGNLPQFTFPGGS